MLKNKDLFNLEKQLEWLDEKNKYNLLKKTSIHEGQPDILAYIYMHKDCTQYEIARYLGLSRASVNTSVKRMQKSGFVSITPSETSKRSTSVNITAEGTKALVKSDMILNEYISKKYENLNEQEIKAYIYTLQKIEKNLTKIYKQGLEDK